MFKIKKLLESSNKIAIFGHENIDWDCIWSMLALWSLLEKQWKKVSYFTPNQPSKLFKFIKSIHKIKTKFDYSKYDLLIFTDFTWYHRIPQFTQNKQKYFDDNNLIIIDHHQEDKPPSNALLIKDTNATSNCEIVFETTYRRRKEYYDSNIATYLYLWLSTDSWNFRFDQGQQTPRIFTNALKLIKLWADKKSIIDNIFRSKSFEAVQFMQKLLSRMILKNNILYTYFTQDELLSSQIDEEEAVYAQTIMQDIIWPQFICVFKVFPDIIKWSLRSNSISPKNKSNQDQIDCRKIASIFGGWWHKSAAWFKVKLQSKNFKKQIDQIINQMHIGF